ncbi:MAG: hypothetical protein MUF75_02820 [Bacteroidia bacterium]|jgi:hypothetical protein|nr:hypothetical protein [Bacteroidia bacterium]
MEEQVQEKRKQRGLILWAMVLLLMGTNAYALWLYWKEKNKLVEQKIITEKIYVERDNVQADLIVLQKEYEELQTSDAKMQVEIEEKKARIAELIEEAKKHKNDARIISALRKETETLRSIMIGYVHTIDSLNTLNIQLKAEKQTVIKKLGEEKEKQNVLIKEKEELKSTIAKGSVLNCFNVVAKAVSFKKSGTKETETNKAKRAQKIKVSFTLGENKIAKKGEKTVYVRVMTPDGKEMAKSYDDSYKFNFDNSSGYFAGKETLNYANAEIDGVTYCEGMDAFVPGTYIIEITCDGVVVGNTTLKLD